MKLASLKRHLKVRPFARFLARFRDEEGGVAAVEFAFTLPIFMGLVIFAAEAARLVYTLSAISFAAAEASRYVVVHQNATEAEVLEVARDSIYGLDPANLQAVLLTAPFNAADQTSLVTITIQYFYEPILPVDVFLSPDYPGGFVLNGNSVGYLIEGEIT